LFLHGHEAAKPLKEYVFANFHTQNYSSIVENGKEKGEFV
jgi:hypothetical protein